MKIKETFYLWMPRVLLCISTSLCISFTALLCAWQEYGVAVNRFDVNQEAPTLWEFVFDKPTQGMQVTCILAGALAFPICLIASAGWRKSHASLALVFVAHAITALFAIVVAVFMSALHIPSGH